jgi:hypothetical protein
MITSLKPPTVYAQDSGERMSTRANCHQATILCMKARGAGQ